QGRTGAGSLRAGPPLRRIRAVDRRNASFMVSLGWVGPEPAPVWDLRLRPHDPFTTFGTGFAHPNEAMNSIHTLHLTGAATLVFQSFNVVAGRPRPLALAFGFKTEDPVPLKCPKCGLMNPDTSPRCDCGQDLSALAEEAERLVQATESGV